MLTLRLTIHRMVNTHTKQVMLLESMVVSLCVKLAIRKMNQGGMGKVNKNHNHANAVVNGEHTVCKHEVHVKHAKEKYGNLLMVVVVVDIGVEVKIVLDST